jgi:hypothetical protein
MPEYRHIATLNVPNAEELAKLEASLAPNQELRRPRQGLTTMVKILEVVPDNVAEADPLDIWSAEQREASEQERRELEAAVEETGHAWRQLQNEQEWLPLHIRRAVEDGDQTTLIALNARKETIGVEAALAEIAFQTAKLSQLYARRSFLKHERQRQHDRCFSIVADTAKAASEKKQACAHFHSIRDGHSYGIDDTRRRIRALRANLSQ